MNTNYGPQAGDCIVVMGKTHAPGAGPRELEARAALAVLVWRRLGPHVPIICVEGPDLPDTRRSGSEVAAVVLRCFGVPDDAIIAPGISNCTAREVGAIATILNKHGRRAPLVVTHSYHAFRTRWYFTQAGIKIEVLPCSPRTAIRWTADDSSEALLMTIARGESTTWNLLRELVVESILTAIHAIDRSARFERWLADRVRARKEVE